MPFGSSPTFTLSITARVFKSKMVTEPGSVASTKPRPNSGATATPCASLRPVILPTIAPESRSITTTSAPCGT